MGFRQPGLDLQTRLFACDLWELQFSFHNPANQDSSSFFFKYLFVYLAALGLSCVMQNLCSVLHHMGTSSLARDRTLAPLIGSAESQPLGHQGSPHQPGFWSLFLMCVRVSLITSQFVAHQLGVM